MEINASLALVAGGGSGLGKATAERLAAAGATVAILDLPDSDGGAVAGSLGGGSTFVPADVTDADAVTEALARIGELGALRIVVNCAGIGTAARLVDRDGTPADLEAFTRTIQVNLIGTFNVMRVAAAEMLRHDHDGEERGVIVNTASVAAYEGQIGQAAYSASKGGVASMTLPIARELAGAQVRVMTIAPGLFRTPMLLGLPEEALTSLGEQVPHPRRLGDPGEYAQLVQSIVENPMLNGEVIRLDGAIRMAPR